MGNLKPSYVKNRGEQVRRMINIKRRDNGNRPTPGRPKRLPAGNQFVGQMDHPPPKLRQ